MKTKKRPNTLRSVAPSTTLLAVCLLVLGLVLFKEATAPTLIARGTITMKQASCSKEVLGSDGSIEKGLGVCDGGNYIDVAGIHIFTGGGRFEPPSKSGKIVDTSPFHAGDNVEVHYVIDEQDGPSTSCHRCNVKKIGE